MDDATFQQMFHLSLMHHRAKDYTAAANLCATLLKKQPDRPEALHLAGRIEMARGRLDIAEAFIRRAVDIKPESPLFLQSLADLRRQAGDAETAARLDSMAILLDSARGPEPVPPPTAPRSGAPLRRQRAPIAWDGDTLVFGTNFFAHDTSIFMIDQDRRDVAAMSEERLTRYKHDFAPPDGTLARLSEFVGIDRARIRSVRFGGSFTGAIPQIRNLKRSRNTLLLRRALSAPYLGDYTRLHKELMSLSAVEQNRLLTSTPEGREALAHWSYPFDSTVNKADSFAANVQRLFPNATVEHRHYDHQFCHAVAAYFSAPVDAGLSITMDGMGDDNVFSRAYLVTPDGFRHVATCEAPQQFLTLGKGASDNRIAMASVGGIYSWITECLGFSGGDEGKVEALAAYGRPIPDLLSALLRAVPLDPHRNAILIDTAAVEKLLNVEAMEALIARAAREDIAATVQKFLEDRVAGYVGHLVRLTGENRLMLSGGVFANVILNLKILEEITDQITVCPAMGDDGSAQGAAILAQFDAGRSMDDLMWLKERQMPYFGTRYGRTDIEAAIHSFDEAVEVTDLGPDWPERVAELVLHHRVGGLFHGRMEWGPRALGNRSIIADPRSADIKDLINLSIKKRTPFQPFCPSILLEEKERLFANAYVNKHMTCAFRLRPEFHEALPSAIHVDGTARVQFVSRDDNPAYHRLLSGVKERTGFGVLLNTSFNKHGRTIVETPEDALRDFIDTDMPFLCMEGILVTRR